MGTPKRILLINPNSNPVVTAGMSEAVDRFRKGNKVAIECVTLAAGPFGIETDQHVADVIPHLEALVIGKKADVYIIGCYSDPGLEKCRAVTDSPVLGIQESAVKLALSNADNFGVLALSEASIARHIPYLKEKGVLAQLAAERPLGLSVAQGEKPEAFPTLLKIGKQLVEQDGAQSLILGCAGMARHREELEAKLKVPVFDPVQSAVKVALDSLA